ncbi:MAG: hypothetical protein IKQ32_04895 [Prevotella sp.]|nr:hypothetical protein [Prevotella sp.]
MLSLIICSVNKITPQWLTDNIKDTVGTEYEIIHIDNSENKYCMCSAYNEGVKRAKGDILCFMHEDIRYYSRDWGKNVEKHMLTNSHVSMLGVFGSKVVPCDYDFRFSGFTTGHLVQRFVRVTDPQEYVLDGVHWDVNGPLEEVAMVDGCWFCIKASLFKGEDAIKFDEKTFDSFHLYDCDICMQVNKKGGGIYIVSDIVLEHFSEGIFANGYPDGIIKFLDKWKSNLPYCIDGMKMEDCQERLNKGKAYYEKILVRDSKIAKLRSYYAAKRAGENVVPLTEEGRKALQMLEFRYAKIAVKYAPNFAEASKAFSVFPNLPMFGKHSKTKILLKLLYYQYLNTRRKKERNQLLG